jgi:hypothetical protein
MVVMLDFDLFRLSKLGRFEASWTIWSPTLSPMSYTYIVPDYERSTVR